MPTIHDVIVIGGGAIGLATTYELAKSGKRVMLLERNNLYNQSGSSADMARMFRTMYTEDFMADMAKDAMAIWDELERDAGDSNLRLMTGLLNFGDPTYGEGGPEGTLMGPKDNLIRLKMPFKVYETAEEIERDYPFKNLPKNFQGLFAPDNGIINVPLLLRTFTRLGTSYGAQYRANHAVHKVIPIKSTEGGEEYWHVEATYTDPVTGNVEHHGHCATKLVIACGAYTNHILAPSFEFKLRLNIWEMTACYWGTNPGPRGTMFPSMWFQFAKNVETGVDENGKKKEKSQLFYGFPTLPWGPENVARISLDDATLQICDPRHRHPTEISPADIANTQEFVQKHTIGVDGTTPSYSLAALQTNVYDNMFVLDFVPEKYLKGGKKDSVAIFTAGWAMKFAPLLGRALKEMVDVGKSKWAYKQFSITRRGPDPGQTIIDYDWSPLQAVQSMSLGEGARSTGAPRGSGDDVEENAAPWQKRKSCGSSMRAI